MPVDWSLYIPVVCVQKDSKYDGHSYMEPIRNVVKLNGQSVTKSDRLKKLDFRSGDRVTILFNKCRFEGIVDLSRDEETVECRSGEPQKSATTTTTTTTTSITDGLSASVQATAPTEIRQNKGRPRPRSQSPSISRPAKQRRIRRQSGT